jgi:glycosyltransferase involved in cell wall biosynthesis
MKGNDTSHGIADRRKSSLIVVVPCLNEENTVGSVVSRVPRNIENIDKVEVIVFDDGSTDATAHRAREAGAEVIRHSSNHGLGATFRDAVGVAIARGADIMVHIDGDGQFDPADIPLLIQPLVCRRADMVTASRFLKKDFMPQMPAVKYWGNRGVALIVRVLSGKQFKDVSCGFRAFSRETLLRMNLFGGFTYTQESFLDLIFKGMTIVEVPIRVRGVREFGTSRVASSIPRYAFRSLKIMLRAFISYRPFRLFLAIALVFFAIASGFLGFLGMHYLETGAFTPHIWAGFVGGSFGFLAFTTMITGLIGDMLVRIRMNQEAILYHLKRAGFESRLAQGRRLRKPPDKASADRNS